MKVAEVVVRILEDEGITAAFGIPGAAINPVYQYLRGSSIKHYIARHEEGAVHAADGYCRGGQNGNSGSIDRGEPQRLQFKLIVVC